MILLLDLGNTRSKYAIYALGNLVIEGVLSNLSPASFFEIPHFNEIEKIAICAVIDLPDETRKILEAKQVRLTPELNANNYSIESLGEDRKFLALGAGANSLVICLGTCITYNYINQANEFSAGAISPGVALRIKSMSEGTAKLPEVKIVAKYPTWGTDTTSNLLAGVMAGIEYEMMGFVSSIKKNNPDTHVILTGGDAPYFAHLFQVDNHLLWKGMIQVIK